MAFSFLGWVVEAASRELVLVEEAASRELAPVVEEASHELAPVEEDILVGEEGKPWEGKGKAYATDDL